VTVSWSCQPPDARRLDACRCRSQGVLFRLIVPYCRFISFAVCMLNLFAALPPGGYPPAPLSVFPGLCARMLPQIPLHCRPSSFLEFFLIMPSSGFLFLPCWFTFVASTEPRGLSPSCSHFRQRRTPAFGPLALPFNSDSLRDFFHLRIFLPLSFPFSSYPVGFPPLRLTFD